LDRFVGIYTALSMKEINKEKLTKYFNKKEENYEVNDSVKKLTRFIVHNLVFDEFLKHLDLILCRNMVIYFTTPLQEMVYSNFARALNKDGFLVLGKVESLWGFAQKYFVAFDNRERIYRKI